MLWVYHFEVPLLKGCCVSVCIAFTSHYLSTIMDLHSRRIIGYSFSKKMATDLVLKTLESAVKNRTITGDLIIHTDLGSQYTSDDYNQRLTELHSGC
ncbi:DDE-type integrase/transposase/recombinase [Lacticaseibacillus paracasei]|uniref:DDE-type integrase/transposase/recombinase n=1 Tax=Lacticaseibacillus paracasei TaxID=1597 RepID=UPI0034E0B98C